MAANSTLIGHHVMLTLTIFVCSLIVTSSCFRFGSAVDSDDCFGDECNDDVAIGGPDLPAMPEIIPPIEDEMNEADDVGRDLAVDHPTAINALKWFQHNAQMENRYPGRLKIIEVLQFKVDVRPVMMTTIVNYSLPPGHGRAHLHGGDRDEVHRLCTITASSSGM